MIAYESFRWLGWEKKDFFKYISLCKELRALAITYRCVKQKTLSDPKEGNERAARVKILEKELEQARDRLSSFLSRFSKNPIELQMPPMYFEVNCAYLGPQLIPWGDEEFECCKSVYLSDQDFRNDIENCVRAHILMKDDSYNPFDFNASELSVKRIKDKITELKQLYDNNEEPSFDIDFNKDTEITEWAKKYAAFYEIDANAESEIDYLESELEERHEQARQKKQEEKEPYIKIYQGGSVSPR